ncbi:MAG: hypothetical protein MK554_07535, partial [Planctomycetes bacterium]|nr:hypothetical protein [Planctomycetota bacterium]
MESAAPEAVAATTEKETAETKSLRSRLGAFAVLLGVHLALLGSFYALAYAYPAKTRIIAARQTWECQAGKSVTITARIHYGMPSLLRAKPPEVKVLIGLQGQKPVDGETTGPASYVRVNLPVPVKPGDY